MTQPKFAPVLETSEVREVLRLPVPLPWSSHRPAEVRPVPSRERRPNTGMPGPDQGYGLALAQSFADQLRVGESEHPEDVLAGAATIGLRRAALFGRAPVKADLELALNLFGYLEGAPEELVDARARYLSGASHDYWQRRDLAEWVPESTLCLTPAQVRAILEDEPEAWRELTGVPD
jgi:hypothetical protein